MYKRSSRSVTAPCRLLPASVCFVTRSFYLGLTNLLVTFYQYNGVWTRAFTNLFWITQALSVECCDDLYTFTSMVLNQACLSRDLYRHPINSQHG